MNLPAATTATTATAATAATAATSGAAAPLAALTALAALALCAPTAPCLADDAVPAPFAAHYGAEWRSITVGTSDLELKQDAEHNRYIYTWTITAHGVFKLAYRDDLVQTSWLDIDAGHARPVRYHAVDGAASVNLDFDWSAARVRGTSEGKPVDFELKQGMQDVMSIQVEVMLDLKNGTLPQTFQIIDKDQPKEFIYTAEGKATIQTALGTLDTVVVSSRRAGNNRILRMWFAPSLGCVPVQAERSREGKLEFAMRIKTLKR